MSLMNFHEMWTIRWLGAENSDFGDAVCSFFCHKQLRLCRRNWFTYVFRAAHRMIFTPHDFRGEETSENFKFRWQNDFQSSDGQQRL